MKFPIAAVALALCLMSVACAAQAATSTVGDCRVGAYRLGDGSVVVINPGDGDSFRWRRLDGTTGALSPGAGGVYRSTLGWTGRPDGRTVSFSDCAKGEVVFDGAQGRRIDFDVTDTVFRSGELQLAGRLVLPKGSGPVPVVVLVHGSESYSGRDLNMLQRLLPAEGVGVFVYDKRGTGHSAGTYTQDFRLLAGDAAGALVEARRMAGARAGRVGFAGGSQGGWVAPLAATLTPADFVFVGFGLLVDPIEEDREQIVLEMKLKGHSEAETAHALEIAGAAAEIVTSHFTRGFDRFDALRARYRNAPWYKDLHGNFTVDLLPYTQDQLLAKSKELEVGTSWDYDGMAVQQRLHIPELWALGADDLDAPSTETSLRLKALMAQGHPITLAVFPHAQHGVYEFETKPDGTRVNTRNALGYLAIMRDFIRDGRVGGPYGAAVVTKPSSAQR